MDRYPSVTLSEVLKNLPDLLPGPLPEATVTGVCLDSRQVQPGCIFIALEGGNTDGHRFISDAIRRGSIAVVGTQPLQDLPIPYVRVEDSRQALAQLSAAFYGFPARSLTVIGVTGTDGKTTTANLIFQILLAAGFRTGMISTVNAVIGDQVLDTGFHVTTPEAPDVQRYLAQMVAAGLTHVILETTSHGLEQQRVAGCEFDVAVVTNINHEHLDYHGTYEAYRSAKARLFTGLGETRVKPSGNPRTAVLNRDDRSFDYLAGLLTKDFPQVRQVTYGVAAGVTVSAESVDYSPAGMRFIALGPEYSVPVETRLLGAFNISNILAAFSAAVEGLGIDPLAACQGIAALSGIPGRMEQIDLGQDFTAMVDFAHTPNALRRVLEAARQLTRERVICVFGSAGLRDRAKRRMMAEISAELADLSILTAEDPRTESLDDILAEMAAGAVSRQGIEGKTFWRIPDRGAAIRFALELASPGDVVMACGKGHEQSMCFGETEYPWDDRVAMRAALSDYLGLSGPRMPYLPTGQQSE
jgi:UDP-N-acetylmuramoyl-L-alanyl-D-glutamate--2,6-diaminopimelate ligase